MPTARATIAEIQRSIQAAEALGKVVRGHEVTKDGTIRVLYAVDTDGATSPNANPADLIEP